MVGGIRIGDVIAPLNQIQLSCPVDSHTTIVGAQLVKDVLIMGTDEIYPTIPVW